MSQSAPSPQVVRNPARGCACPKRTSPTWKCSKRGRVDATGASGSFQSVARNRLNSRINYDSVNFVTYEGHRISLKRQQIAQGLALAFLLVVGGLAIAGPSGLLAWSENLRLFDERRAHLSELRHERNELKQLVNALDPERADPDLVGELIRENLNVIHPDEVVITLEEPQN